MAQLIATFTDEIKTVLGTELQKLDSVSLRLEKFTFLGDNSKLQQINATCTKAARQKFPPTSLASTLTNKQNRSKQFILTLGGRMIVNHAGGILENAGLCLHRFFNYPMIPGSALKGIALHYAVHMWRNKLASPEDIVHIFGYPTNIRDFDATFCLDTNKRSDFSQAGNISFMQAIPADTNWRLVADVLTPHGENDYTNPVPNFFIAVEKEAKFSFTLFKLTKATDNDLNMAESFLRGALCENGVGAKTAAGYGWFTGQDSIENSVKLKLITPGFFGGANHKQPQDIDLRVPSLRGM
ncbi:MAG: type III-B CRISPR module RAMP protein Cmr6, partial [Victivallaceae bacterium]|nr:type III-B CRISPR module RAMP protein Cmr6 [Victivallaceae bacterium]